jgi:hypothetical protein
MTNNDIRMIPATIPGQFSPAEVKTGLEENYGPTRNEYVEQLKHSIRTHVVIMNGVSDQLCAYLLKMPDFLTDTDFNRRDSEIASLSYSIIEAAALYVSGTIDSFSEKYISEGREFPEEVSGKSNAIIVQVGTNRGSRDKIGAKNSIMKATADALNAFSQFSGTQFPQLVDINGIPL